MDKTALFLQEECNYRFKFYMDLLKLEAVSKEPTIQITENCEAVQFTIAMDEVHRGKE